MSTDPSLEQRIARLEAIEAIKQLKATYFYACDHKQPELVRQCYLDGPVELDFGRVGQFSHRDELVDVFTELACQPHIIEMHHAQNPRIQVEDEGRATGTWGLYYFLIETRQNLVTQLGGFYEDEYRCVGGDWKIAASTFTVTSTLLLDSSDELLKTLFAGHQAPVEIDDPNRQGGDSP